MRVAQRKWSAQRPPVELPPFHRDFSWLQGDAQSNAHAQFAARVMDISRGTKVVAEILRTHLLNLEAIDTGVPTHTLMSVGDIDALAGLATVSLDALYQVAEQQVDFFNRQTAQGARA